MNERRVVVTGCGVISCVGQDVASFWNSLVEGKCGISPITLFDASDYRTRIAGEVKDFDPCRYMSFKEAKRMDRFCQFAVCAGLMAVKNAGLPENFADSGIRPERVGVMVSSGIGGMAVFAEQIKVLNDRGPDRVSPLLIPMMIGDIASGNLSMRIQAKGPNFGLVSACSTGNHSIGEASWIIRRGDADIMIAGGAEAPIVPVGVAGFCAMKAMSQRNDDPLHASRPFDLDRDGFIMSEGAGVLILEELEHAKARGAQILAELVGYGCTGDAYHITSPHPEGEGAAEAMRVAMAHAAVNPGDVDYINAHGTSTELNDKYETLAVKRVFGESARKVAISSTKGTTGHGLGAAGGFECIACIHAIRDGIVPPTINYVTPDPNCDLDITPNTARKRDIRYAMNVNLGFGGHNAAVIFKRFED